MADLKALLDELLKGAGPPAGPLSAVDLLLVQSESGLLAEKKLVTADILASYGSQQLISFGFSEGVAALLKKAFPGAGAGSAFNTSSLREALETVLSSFQESAKQAMQDALREQALDALSMLEVSPSSAGSSTLNKLMLRSTKTLVKGLFFPHPARPWPVLADFPWPTVVRKGKSREDELAGYEAAVQWLQQHVCPPGVRAVLKYSAVWLSSSPLHKVHIKDGSVDVIFVLEEHAAKVEDEDADMLEHILTFCGQCELKTQQTMQERKHKCIAQAGIEHISAAFLLDTVLRAQAQATGVELDAQHDFMTVLTDLNQCWSKLSYTDEHFTIVQHAPEAPVTDDAAAAAAADLRTAAVVHIKYALGQSAARLKAILRQVSGPMTEPEPPNNGASGSSGDRGGGNSNADQPSSSSGGRGGGNSNADRPSRSTGQDAERPAKQARLGDGAATTSQLNMASIWQMGRSFKERLLNDSDLQRDVEAAHSVLLVDYLRSSQGYSGLLGLASAPSSIQHPPLLELLQQPWKQQAASIAEAMKQLQEGGGNAES